MTNNRLYRLIPNMTTLLERPDLAGIARAHAKRAAEVVLASIREDIATGRITSGDEIEAALTAIPARAKTLAGGSLVPAINATGVIIHTNLGRSPLPSEAVEEIARLSGYSNLEYDLAAGGRGERYHHAAELLRRLTGAEDAVVVNNNASAVFLVLNTFAKRKRVVVSRGELVEIGGSFRVPDVMREAGALLTEVGTTNKTRPADYTDAVDGDTAMFMKIHRSNFEIIGFTDDIPPLAIPGLASDAGVMSYYDAGSGLVRPETDPLKKEPSLEKLMEAGFDLVSASGDKLLGGPQAGIILGKKHLIDRLKKNPLIRMLRVDKLTLAALQAVLRIYIEERYDDIPAYRMITADMETLSRKADRLTALIEEKNIPGATVTTGFDESTIGGGSSATGTLPTRIVSLIIDDAAPETVEARLRTGTPPVIPRIRDEAVIFDVRTLDDHDLSAVADALARAAGAE